MNKRKLLILVLGASSLLAGGLAAAICAARWALAYKAPCAQPCQDLGPPAPEYRVDTTDYSDPTNAWAKPENSHARFERRELWEKQHPPPSPRCNPLRLTLELAKPEARANTTYTLWYKVALKNVSCERLCSIDAEAFMFVGVNFHIKIWDSKGIEIEEYTSTEPDYYAQKEKEYGDIIPYTDDSTDRNRLLRDPDLQLDKYELIQMNPGKTIATPASILDPYTKVPTVRLEGDLLIHGWAAVKADLGKKQAPKPPPGFRILDNYLFRKPGTCRIQVIYDGKMRVEPIYPYVDRVPDFLMELMMRLGVIHDFPMFNPAYKARDYHVHAESKILSFQVKP